MKNDFLRDKVSEGKLGFISSGSFERSAFNLAPGAWIKGACGFLITLGIITFVSQQVALVYSRTDSLPYHLFLQFKQVSPKRGDYTCFDSPWYGGRVIKKVGGMAGDTLAYDQMGSLWINALWVGKALKVGKQKRQAKDGRPLTPIQPGVIPQGLVFLTGDHERSFDSRYAELGLVPENALQGKLLPIV